MTMFFPRARGRNPFRVLYCLLPLWLATPAAAQLSPPWQLDPYGGVTNAVHQPAAGLAAPYRWEVNLVTAGAALDNDYAYLRSTSLAQLLRAARATGPSEGFPDEEAFDLNGVRFDYGYLDRNHHFALVGADALGPAVSLRIGNYTRVGLYSRARALVSARRVSGGLSSPTFNATPEEQPVPVGEIFLGGAGWAEAGLNLARAIPVGADAELRLGLNAKWWAPVAAASLYNPDGGDLLRLTLDSIGTRNATTTINLTDEIREVDDTPPAKGRSYGLDLGLQYAWYLLDDGSYRYSAGLSVTDLGRLSFTEHSQRHEFRNPGRIDVGGDPYADVGSTDELLRTLSQQFNGDSLASLSGGSFMIGAPTAVGLQFAVRATEAVQFGVAYRGGLPGVGERLHPGTEVRAYAQYVKWWYGGGLNVGLSEWRYPNLGGYLRLGPLLLGSNHLLGTLLPAGRLRGADVYVGLRVHDLGLRKRRRRGRGSKRRRGREVRCYQF